MLKTNKKKRNIVLEPLFNMALRQAKGNTYKIENLNDRLTYCIQLLAGNNPIPASPREIAQGLLNMAGKMGGFTPVTEHITPHEVTSWTALEMLARNLMKINEEKGLRCLELATLYQIRYWTQSPNRFHGTEEDKTHYVQALSSLLGKLGMLDMDFHRFDNWFLKGV